MHYALIHFQYPTLGSNHRYLYDGRVYGVGQEAFSILLSDRTIATQSQRAAWGRRDQLSVSYSRIEPSLRRIK